MGKSEAAKPSEEEMWAGPSGERWLANAARFEAALQPFGDALIAQAKLKPGERVIDVGCGAGAMSLRIAEIVGRGAGGSVTGLDISEVLVAEGNRRAAALHPPAAARFVAGDAAKAELPAADVVMSRFGVMFFTDPFGAFRHLHTLLRDGGRLAFACWMPLQENPWMLEVRKILAGHFDLPAPPPRTPGPFAFEEPAYVREILGKAGFEGVAIAPLKLEMYIGGEGSDPASAAEFLMHALSMAQRALDAPEALRDQVRGELAGRLREYNTAGGVRMPAGVWLVSAGA